MTLEMPPCDDRPIWDVWLSLLWLPAVTVADELEIFESLAREPATPVELAVRHGFDLRGIEILLSLLTSLRFCVSHLGRYQVTEPTRSYLLRTSPFYWGGVFVRQRTSNPIHGAIRGAIVKKGHRIVGQAAAEPPVEMWESGQMTLEAARGIAAFMHSHSLAAATGMALRTNLSGVKRLLDVGGGSGCFCITLAQQNPQLRCTMMDLKPMCEVALEYITAAGVSERVGVQPVNMFQEAWPAGHDAMLFSNVFHDWGPETNAKLAANAFAALPQGGRILVHEMLLDDSGNGPVTTAAFSALMLANTRGRQFTFQQVKSMLEEAGFADIDVVPTYSYYSVVSGTKR
ncbi:methyltransferase [Hyalangium sp.]|uniref:methyltransferase n=1 Tax=Hyalangium sp. TaxID=2028555 RepID=UPI002D490474|nr:methyltransferase [Hyalangium sp.]HYH97302.1 methyltransferase [Hyalangium sp.]